MQMQVTAAIGLSMLACAFGCMGTVEPHGTRAGSRDVGAVGNPIAVDADGNPVVGDGDGLPVDGDGQPVGGAPVPGTAAIRFRCDAAMHEQGTPWRRLSRQQYENTLADLLTLALDDRERALTRMQAIAPLLEHLPAEERFRSAEDLHGSYRRLDQVLSQTHVEAYFRIAQQLGTELTSSSARMQRLVGPCATDGAGNDAECLDAFIERFGALALRRPLDAEEVAFYRGFYGGAPGENPLGYADVVAGLLMAPQFLYIIEHATDTPGPGADSYQLTAFELASRLSYHFWDSMPDAALWEAARSGALLDAQTYAKEVERVFHDPRTRPVLREFYRDWLKLEDLPALDQHNGSLLYQAFAGADLPNPALRERMIDEALDMVDHFTWSEPVGFEALFTSDEAFARTPDLAQIYGIETWDGESDPPAFAPGERPGLLTRAAFLATGTPNTRPIMKGVFMRENILCDKIPPPPDNAGASPPELSATSSTREVVEALTQQEGTPCAACHTGMINPLGFATEGFDALGRMRRAQALFSDDGTPMGSAHIDTTSVPQVILGDPTPSEGPEDLMYLVADSGKAHACFVRHYFRFSFGRFEDLATDGCALERMRETLSETGSIAAVLEEVAMSPEFRRRRFVY